ncbi:histone-arginine methyltransferase CARMER isoform X6 [Nasonia vitripennis]|uniref:type I protein arginine methyltransferase n=1 Tax=Nasonia vitripennis TaxID=7425 RepID=A0A7M7Q5F2_NASVI|nr:histone-arginine methyltransferase CARMER isoform X6 [Nasonia vitripennis]
MANVFKSVRIWTLLDNGKICPVVKDTVILKMNYDPHGFSIKVETENNQKKTKSVFLEIPLTHETECSKVSAYSYVLTIDPESYLLTFEDKNDFQKFHIQILKLKKKKACSVFNDRTEESSAMQYFQFYGYLSQQQNMMQDYVRTSTYQRAILGNSVDFKDKIILDVGAGSGILSFFAVQAGAKKVYAVEASNMAYHAELLVAANNLSSKIIVVAGKIEEIEVPELVDCIVSEPMGYMLYNERMLETYLHAKKWLVPGIDVDFHILESGTCHGLAFWFDVAFIGSTQQVWLSTAPTEPLTHWYQVRCLLENPLFCKSGQLLSGRVNLIANKRQSYDVTIELKLEGTNLGSSKNTLDLKNPYFRYTGAAAQPPPGLNNTSPSESYWNTIDAQGARQAVNMVNGISINGLGEVSMEAGSAVHSSTLIAVGQPNIHPGLISSTGRGRVSVSATSTQAAQLIGGGITPNLFTSPSTICSHRP